MGSYPKPHSICLRGTIGFRFRFWGFLPVPEGFKVHYMLVIYSRNLNDVD